MQWTSVLKIPQRLSMPSQRYNCLGVRGLALILLLLAVLGPGVAQSDTLLVSTGSNTILEFSLTGQDLGTFASTGLSNPLGLALDRSGNLYVANVGSSTIRKFSPTGQDLGLFASLLGIGCPTGLAVDRSGNLLVADLCVSVVREFSPTGQDLGTFASTGLSNPEGLAFDSAGDLFVSNTGSDTIRKFSPTGQDLGLFASTGLHFPAGLALDRSGNLYVANEGSNTIRKFSPTGQDLGDFAVLSTQSRFLVIAVPAFAGTPGSANCHGQSVSALARQFGGLRAAASALGFPSVQALQDALWAFCEE